MRDHQTAEQMVLDALSVLQRGLPPGDLDDRQVVTELWGIFDNPASRRLIERAKGKSKGQSASDYGQ